MSVLKLTFADADPQEFPFNSSSTLKVETPLSLGGEETLKTGAWGAVTGVQLVDDPPPVDPTPPAADATPPPAQPVTPDGSVSSSGSNASTTDTPVEQTDAPVVETDAAADDVAA